MSKQIVIVGVGPGGLAAAMLLAQSGAKVTVLEKRDRVGGRTSTITTDQGFKFDMGPTFFLYPRILEEVFAMCGRDLHQEVEMVRLDPQYHLLFEGDDGKVMGDLRATPDVERMQAEIARISPEDAQRFPRFIEENREKFDAFTPILQKPWQGVTDYVNLSMMKMLPLVRPWASVDGDLGRYFKDERIRLAFSFQSKYLGMSPFKCPSLFTILSYLEYDYGVFHPTGGCAAVSDAMARVAEEMGVDIRLNAGVDAMRFEGKRCVGVTAGGEDLEADAVVVNADFANAMNQLVPDGVRRRWTDAKLETKKYSCSTFMMYLGVDIPPDELGGFDGKGLEHHSIFLAKDYPKNLDEIENQHKLSDNPSVYVQHAGRTDPTMAPDGMTSLYILAPVTHEHGNVDWSQQLQPFRAKVMHQLTKLGLPADLESRIRYEKVMTPVTWRTEMDIYKGATFNLAHNLGQMLHLRPQNRFEDVDGVYLVGGGTHPGSGLPVIYEGARITSRLLLEDLGMSASWQAPEPATATPGFAPAVPSPATAEPLTTV
ncbi:MAG: phytoene desaturase family protein [Planctomycetota bacterium]